MVTPSLFSFRGAGLAAAFAMLLCHTAQAAVKERIYTMGDNDAGAVAGGQPPLNPSSNRRETVDIQPSTTDYRGTDPPSQVNISLVPLKSFNVNFAPVYALANDRPGATAGNLALVFDGVNDNMFSDSFDPRDFGGNFETLSQVWVKPTSATFTADQYLFRTGAENGGAKITVNGKWALRTGNGANLADIEVESNVSVVPNQWTHLAVLRGGNASILYVNGSVAARDAGFWGGEGPEVTIGANSFGIDSFFKGVIDNFNIAGFADDSFDVATDIDYYANLGITFSGVDGDVNQDGVVNASDYQVWSQNVGFNNGFGQGDPGTLLKGDVDQSGVIDLFDFRIITREAANPPVAANGAGVPEPSAIALLLIGFAPMAVGCGRRLRANAATSRVSVASLVVLTAVLMSGDTAHAAVVVADDFLYDGASKALHVGGGFNGFEQYGGGQNGTAGRWTTLWDQIGDGIIATPEYVPPGDPEPNTPTNVALYDGFFGVESELFRNFELADSVSPTQTLYFGGRFKADVDIDPVPQFYAPRLFLNRIFGDDRDTSDPQRDRTQDIAIGFQEDMVIARLGAGPETQTVAPVGAPDDGNWHTVIGKLELNVSGGVDERLTVWLDPTGTETGGTTAQVVANVLPDLNSLIGTFHSQGTVPTDPDDPELGRSYIDDMVIGTAWQDVATVNVPRLTLRINPTTGAGKLINGTTSSFQLDSYSIESESGALNGAGWNSLDEQNVGNWQQNLATANQLVESFFAGSSTIAPGGQLALGNLFSTGGAQDVVGRFSTQDGLINVLKVEFSTAGLAGDYDADADVDGADFLVWQRAFGSNVTPGTGADGDSSGTIGAGDLTVWRNNFGQMSATTAVGAIPEPGACLLIVSGMAAMATIRRPSNRLPE
jgi:hypothetical protein